MAEYKIIYKKKEGTLALSDDQTAIVWTPRQSDQGRAISLTVSNITNLQRTPESAARVILKVFEKPASGDGDAVAFSFQFISPTNARAEVNALTEQLQRLLQEIKSNDSALPRPLSKATANGAADGSPGSASASMSFASTAISRPSATSRWFDDEHLVKDIEMQASLMREDKSLKQTYLDAAKQKPESLSDLAFAAQFWSTRTNLLRAHAISSSQKEGAYNVLSTLKPVVVDNKLTMNIGEAQVNMIFKQHPLVTRIYNGNVPKVPSTEFWSRFFLSKLFKKLKGERLSDGDHSDHLFDKYIDADDTVAGSKILSSAVPNIIDIERNEENQGGFRSGNRKDVEMRPRSNIPIMKTLNSLSERIMLNVAPSDMPASGAMGPDDGSYNELALRDLRSDVETMRVVLNVREQNQFFSNQHAAPSAGARAVDTQPPSEVLFDVQADLDMLDDDGAGGIDLDAGLGIDEDSDSEEESRKRSHVGSRASRRAAHKQILVGLERRRAELFGHGSDASTPMGLSKEITEQAKITNATSVEFLKQFWRAFLSGDPDRAQELGYYADSLRRSGQRIEAVAEEAEKEREAIIALRKEESRQHFQKTKRKLKWRPEMVKGGRKAVMILLGPTVESLKRAENLYREALAAEGMQLSTET